MTLPVVCPFKTCPCVHSKRLCVCGHHAHMCFNMCAWCRYTRGRFESTHGGVWNIHTAERRGGHRQFCSPWPRRFITCPRGSPRVRGDCAEFHIEDAFIMLCKLVQKTASRGTEEGLALTLRIFSPFSFQSKTVRRAALEVTDCLDQVPNVS